MNNNQVLTRISLLGILLFVMTNADAADLMQNVGARQSIDLNGEWHIIVDPYENGFYNHRYEEKDDGWFLNLKAELPSDLVEYNFATSPTLTVPGDWNSQDDRLFFYEGTVWYQRDFAIEMNADKHYILHFDGANYLTVVYVNGTKVGVHEGGFTAFQFEVTEHLKDGDNFVVVKIDNRRERDNIPTVNTDWWNFGGLTRPVTLLEMESTYIADYFIQLDAVADDVISGWVQLDSNTASYDGDIRLEVPGLGIDTTFSSDDSGHAEFRFDASPEMWSPENPKRYDVRISYGDDAVNDQIGFRRVAVRGDKILLNGEPIYLRGISIHEEAPLREGRAWSEEDARTTLTWAKELGCNFVRLAHYPHNEAIVRMADEMGLLVWSEIPVYWTIKFEEEYVFDKAEQQLGEMISRDKNRAAVILWSVANETPIHRPATNSWAVLSIGRGNWIRHGL